MGCSYFLKSAEKISCSFHSIDVFIPNVTTRKAILFKKKLALGQIARMDTIPLWAEGVQFCSVPNYSNFPRKCSQIGVFHVSPFKLVIPRITLYIMYTTFIAMISRHPLAVFLWTSECVFHIINMYGNHINTKIL